jgi:GDP-L-fucose synthase
MIYVAGHRGMVGAAITRAISGWTGMARSKLDLFDHEATEEFFRTYKPETVYLAAARVGGIGANVATPGDFIRENLAIQTNVIDSAMRHGCRGLLFLGSSCIYPRYAVNPIHESAIGTGSLEPTNEAYAMAKLAGIAMLKAYRQQFGFRSIAVMPSNMYGPGDNYDAATSHVVPSLLRRFNAAKNEGALSVTLWGTGCARREFLHVNDCARACVHLMREYGDIDGVVNVGTGEDMSIREVAGVVRRVVGYQGDIIFDGDEKKDGMPAKRLDISRVTAMGWTPTITLEAGLWATYQAMLAEGT